MIRRFQKEQRYSLEDIDERLENFSEFAKALGMDPQFVMSRLLTSLKLKLNNEVKITSSAKRQRLLEYLFPYAVLPDYSPLVTYLLEKEEDIPQVVVDKLLHDATYKEYLTPQIKMNIYKREPSYFDHDVESAINALSFSRSSLSNASSKCCCFDKAKLTECLKDSEWAWLLRFTCRHLPSLNAALQLTGNDDILKGRLLRHLIQRGITLRKEGSFESAFQIFDLAYGLLKEHLQSLFHIVDCNLDPAQKKAATEPISQILKSLEIALKSDRTSNPNRDKRGSFNIFSTIFDLLHKLHAKSTTEAPRPDAAQQLTQKRRQLYRAAIDRMMTLDTTHIFSQPVDATLVPDYYTVIKKPMDLSRMRQRAEQYQSAHDMRNDIDLIVANALYYNGAQSPIAQAAVNLKNVWLECCLKCELQEKSLLKATSTTPTTPTFSISLSFLLVVLAVVLSTPALYAQLLRAVYQRVMYLLSNSTMPSENNVLDPVLFSYFQLLALPDHLEELIDRTAGKSQFFPQGLFATAPTADVPTCYCDFLLYLVQQAVYSSNGKEDEETNQEIQSSLQNPLNRHLYYSAVEVQAFQALGLADGATDLALFESMMKLLVKLPESVLESEWSWIDAIEMTMCVSRVG